MDAVMQLVLEDQIHVIEEGRIIHVNGIPCEVLDPVRVYTASGSLIEDVK